MALSRRGSAFAQPDPSFRIFEILTNLWSPADNPDGFVNLGVAENSLMRDVLSRHIHSHFALPNAAFTYGDGGKTVKAAIAHFLTRQLAPVEPIQPAHVTHTNGCSSAVELLAWALGNPGDAFVLGRPYYGTFVADVTARFGTQLALVSFDDVDPLSMAAVAKYEDKIEEAQAKGQRVAGLILAHPHNPLGRCYPRPVLVELMKVCQRYGVHLISDEIYALSTFDNTVDASGGEPVPFESVLSIESAGIIDPALVHVVWGMSKDFGANGLRVGSVISQHNPSLHAALVPVSIYASTSSLSEHVTANVLTDDAFVDEYIAQNRAKLARNYEYITSWAKSHEIEYVPGVSAAFFLWVNLGKAYQDTHPGHAGDLDQVVMDALLNRKVFLASGVAFGSEKPGWFRIVFSLPQDYLEEGLRRVIDAVQTVYN